jgi:branched-chain amino acid transport system ATP-binding protein
MTGAPLLAVSGVTKRFGGFTALQDIAVDIAAGERFGLIGPNGSGKTTLINCISGALRNDAGSIVFAGREISRLPAWQRTRRGIARSFQIPRPFRSMSVLENLLVAIDFAAIGHGLSVRQAEAEVGGILERIGLADKARTSAGRLSQVELRKLELARALAARPKLLISDEAMAGLAGAEIDEVLDLLLALNGDGITIIMIEHIMHAVMRFSQRVMCLDAGRIICQGTPAEVMADSGVQEAYLGA